jgi:hypothetical protein
MPNMQSTTPSTQKTTQNPQYTSIGRGTIYRAYTGPVYAATIAARLQDCGYLAHAGTECVYVRVHAFGMDSASIINSLRQFYGTDMGLVFRRVI